MKRELQYVERLYMVGMNKETTEMEKTDKSRKYINPHRRLEK